MRRDFVCGSNVPVTSHSGNGTPHPSAKRVVVREASIGSTAMDILRQADAAAPHNRADR